METVKSQAQKTNGNHPQGHLLIKARGQVDLFTPSLLARAFAGKLVPQDPTDEPASVLLQRIHAHRHP